MHILARMGKRKIRITMMLDEDLVGLFKKRAARPGGEPYQTQINRALREYTAGVSLSVRDAVARVAERAARYSTKAATSVKRREPPPVGAGRVQRTIKAAIRDGEQSGYVAECLEIPVVTQGATLDEVAANLCEAVALHLENEDLEALGLAREPTLLVTLELHPAHA